MIEINVLPEGFRPTHHAPGGLVLALAFGLVLTGLLALYALEERAALARATQKNQNLAAELAVARLEKAKVDALRAQIAHAERRQNTILEIAQSKIVWSQKLVQFSKIMADFPAFWIDRLTLARGGEGPGTLTLGFQGEGVSLTEIAALRERLRLDTSFAYHFQPLSAPRITKSMRGSASVVRFDMALPVK